MAILARVSSRIRIGQLPVLCLASQLHRKQAAQVNGFEKPATFLVLGYVELPIIQNEVRFRDVPLTV